jgi:hypothetical protein
MNFAFALLIELAFMTLLGLSAAGFGYMIGGKRSAIKLASAVGGFFGVYLGVVLCLSFFDLPTYTDIDQASRVSKLSLFIGVAGAMAGFFLADFVLPRERLPRRSPAAKPPSE